MTNNEYNLIKLAIEMTELDPYSFDHDIFSYEELKPEAIKENIELYCEATAIEDMTEDEIILINKIKKELKEYYEDYEKVVTISYELTINTNIPLTQEETEIITGVIEERIEVEKNYADTFTFIFET